MDVAHEGEDLFLELGRVVPDTEELGGGHVRAARRLIEGPGPVTDGHEVLDMDLDREDQGVLDLDLDPAPPTNSAHLVVGDRLADRVELVLAPRQGVDLVADAAEGGGLLGAHCVHQLVGVSP